MKIIKSLLLLCILCIPVALLTSANASSIFGNRIKASGKIETKTFNIPLSSYVKIAASSIANVKIVEGEGEIVVKIDSNIAPYLVVKVSGYDLIIKLEDNLNFKGNITFDVVVPCGDNLKAISASGGADVVSELVLDGDNILLTASGGADLSAITSGRECDVRASGGSDINLDCKSEMLIASASGGADIVIDLVSNRCEARSSGGSDITLRGEVNHAKLSASGGSDICARDLISETREVNKSGGADVRLQNN